MANFKLFESFFIQKLINIVMHSRQVIYKADKTLLQKVTSKKLDGALLEVPEHLRSPLTMYLLEDLSLKDIALKTKQSPSTVHKKIRQGFYYLDKYFNTGVYQKANAILYGKSPNKLSY